MEKQLERLKNELVCLVELNQQLLKAVQDEKNHLIQANLQLIQRSIEIKQELTEKVKYTESRRLKTVSELAVIFQVEPQELTLARIIMILETRGAHLVEDYKSLYEKLRALIDEIRLQDLNNGELIKKSLEHIHEMKRNILGESNQKAVVYNAQGQRSLVNPNHRMICQEL